LLARGQRWRHAHYFLATLCFIHVTAWQSLALALDNVSVKAKVSDIRYVTQVTADNRRLTFHSIEQCITDANIYLQQHQAESSETLNNKTSDKAKMRHKETSYHEKHCMQNNRENETITMFIKIT
jgi:hypothetical protein